MLPRPSIEYDKSNAYISITDLIRHMFAIEIHCQSVLSKNRLQQQTYKSEP